MKGTVFHFINLITSTFYRKPLLGIVAQWRLSFHDHIRRIAEKNRSKRDLLDQHNEELGKAKKTEKALD